MNDNKRYKPNIDGPTPTAVSSETQVSIIIHNLLYIYNNFFSNSPPLLWLRSEDTSELYFLDIFIYFFIQTKIKTKIKLI